jgi:hypothetical protein
MSSKKIAKQSIRKSPSESATLYNVGTIMKGNDKRRWVVIKTNNGIKRWMLSESADLNGLKKISLDYLAKHVNKIVKLYCRGYQSFWPNKKDWSTRNGENSIITFIPTGNLIVNKKIIQNGIIGTLNSKILQSRNIEIEGYINFDGTDKKENFVFSSLQMDHKNLSISTNLMNIEIFVENK